MRRMLQILLAVIIAFAVTASPVGAQTPTSYTLKTFNVGAAQPLQTFSLQATATVCNQVKPADTTVNPGKVGWADPVNAGKVCIWTDPGTGPLFAAPTPGSYELTVAAVNTAGASADSARVPFARLAAPTVPTGVFVAQ